MPRWRSPTNVRWPALSPPTVRHDVASRPRLCFVGPMLGVNPGWVTSQGELLAELLTGTGYPVRITSHRLERLPRLLDILGSLVTWRNEILSLIHISEPTRPY